MHKPTCRRLIRTVSIIGTGGIVVGENMRVCLRMSLCGLPLNTVILQEHSNCPIHRPPGAFHRSHDQAVNTAAPALSVAFV